mmetsp:Transcript_19486/g.22293  ORF Transcript_19486/g.22293 Transcript_19486/m.22293 type:complete len:743 (+) Transcript_19486:296-2524(+)
MSPGLSTSSREIKLERKEKECVDLERRLEKSQRSKSSNKKTEKIWYDLCQHFGNILMNYPLHALHYRTTERLWTIAYKRISEERKAYSEVRKDQEKTQTEKKEAKMRFRKFLQEFIDYYDEIKKKYLLSFDSKAFEHEIENVSHDHSKEYLEEADKPAIIPILYRLLITLGDLYRYQNRADDAFHNYDLATFLSPGQGNHYNQMAVLEVDKLSSCNALYYYARSIKASHKPFETSIENVERLYSSNQNWLNENNKAASQTGNSRKFQIKLFTAQFVDLHRGLKQDTDPAKTHDSNTSTTLQMETVIREFEDVLNRDVFGDKFLCMMVSINAFSASECGSVAHVLVFRFGTALTNFVERNISKKLTVSRSQSVTTIRGLLPLLLVCDHILTFDNLHKDETFQTAEETFWTKVCTLASKLNTGEHSLALEESSLKNKLPKEYLDYKGFTPFESFISKPCEFTTFENAKDIVPKAKNIKLESEKKDILFETRVKLAHLLAIMEKADCLVMGKDNRYIFLRNSCGSCLDLKELSISDREAEMISYKPPQHGSGPALLVPGAMLVGKVGRKIPNDGGSGFLPSSSSMSRVHLIDDHDQKFAKHHLPQTENIPRNPHNGIVLNPLPDEGVFGPPLAPPPGLTPPPGLKPPPGFVSLTQNSIPSPQHEDVWDFLSKRSSKSPFAEHRTLKEIKKIVEPDYTNNFLYPDEPTTLLDSSLLQSLFGDESKGPITNNPFSNYRAHIWQNGNV